ncbi:hypothetical protein [Enterococcus canis]|uniref:hypothetical protein n=1 Tax=Enterococcus canis TaxID=214095 RepID=UPI0008339BE5|nr:hypothetical protein [Enterococcus canis]
MEDEQAVRIILSAGKDSIRYTHVLLKKYLDSKGKVANFTDSEVLDKSLSESTVAIKELKSSSQRFEKQQQKN